MQQALEVTLYTLPGCRACEGARRLLVRRGIRFQEVDLSLEPRRKAALLERTGSFTVPQVVIGGEPVGGTDALRRLDRRGVLLPLVEGAKFPLARVRRRLYARSLWRWLRTAGRTPARLYVVELVSREGRRRDLAITGSAEEADRLARPVGANRSGPVPHRSAHERQL